TPPRLAGAHQHDNASLAVAMMRHQEVIAVPESALRAAPGWANWPARLQHLEAGQLVDLAPRGSTLWLDGGHNPAAGRAVADFLRRETKDRAQPVHIICGMIAGKDVRGFLKPLAQRADRLTAVPVEDHEMHDPADLAAVASELGLAAETASSVVDALRKVDANPVPPLVLICGSLYLAGTVLAENGPLPS
ncbi:MAG: bifunctional folylpolyglutamate synthase/dihydrofolate synthase, partial [Pacificimonas sp.]